MNVIAGWSGNSHSRWLNLSLRKPLPEGCQGLIGVSKELAPANSVKPPSEPFQNRLAGHVLRNLLSAGVPAFAIAFNGKFSTIALHDHVYPIVAHRVLSPNRVATRLERFQYKSFKLGLRG